MLHILTKLYNLVFFFPKVCMCYSRVFDCTGRQTPCHGVFGTCCEMLETLLVLRRKESLWQTVRKELGRMERKSLKDRRRVTSVPSPVPKS